MQSWYVSKIHFQIRVRSLSLSINYVVSKSMIFYPLPLLCLLFNKKKMDPPPSPTETTFVVYGRPLTPKLLIVEFLSFKYHKSSKWLQFEGHRLLLGEYRWISENSMLNWPFFSFWNFILNTLYEKKRDFCKII